MPYDYKRHVPSRAEIVIGKAADAWRRWSDRREFARFSRDYPAEAHRLAQDLSTDEASLMQIAGQDPPILLRRRLRALGIDPVAFRRAEPHVARDLARCCGLCGHKSQCADDLACDPESEIWRSYCPNEQTLTAMRPRHVAPSRAA